MERIWGKGQSERRNERGQRRREVERQTMKERGRGREGGKK